MDQFSQGTFAS